MRKLFYYDLETTGLYYWKHGIHQIAGIIEIDGKIVEELNFKVKPNPAASIELEALEVANVTKEQVFAYTDMHIVFKEAVGILGKYVDKFNPKDKFTLVGFNNKGFDDNFFRAWFVQNFDNYFGSWFWSSSVDVMSMAAAETLDVRADMKNFKLVEVCRHFGIEVEDEKLHDANYDVRLTRELFLLIEYYNTKDR